MNQWLASLPVWLQFLHPQVLCARFIIIERNGGIGDVICLLPALSALRRKHPRSRLIMITSLECVPLVRRARVVDAVLPSGTRGLAWLRKKGRAQFDIHPLLPDEHSPPLPRSRIHLMEEFARCLSVADGPFSLPHLTPPYKSSQSISRKLRQTGLFDQPLVVIHTGPTWPVKQWPLDNWCQLVARLSQQLGLTIIQVGVQGHSSDPKAQTPLVSKVHNWVGILSLDETMALIAHSRLFIGVDSGLLHMANALRIPAVGLFGPTDPDCFMPLDHGGNGLHSDIACLGCHHHPKGPQHWRSDCPHHIQCMRDLSVDQVLQKCLILLSSPF